MITISDSATALYNRSDNLRPTLAFVSFLCLTIGAFIGIVTTILFLGYNSSNSFIKVGETETQVKEVDSRLLNSLETYIKNNYYGDPKSLSSSMHQLAKAYIESLGDEHSFYLDPKESEEYRKSFNQDFEGIGVILTETRVDDAVYVSISSIINGGSASRDKEIKKGLMIIKVDGVDVLGMKPQQVASKIRGPAGTAVNITFIDPSNNKNYETTLVRERIVAPNITLSKESIDSGILYFLSISDFIDESIDVFNNSWDEVLTQLSDKNTNYASLIIDLRSNTGGYVDSAIYLSESFLPPNKIIMSEVNSSGTLIREVKSRRDKDISFRQIFILVDSATASAAEIFTLALKENLNNVVIVGENTYGKGSEQKMIQDFAGFGGLLNLTFQKWRSPSGNMLAKDNPIIPDIRITDISRKSYTELKGLLKELRLID